MNSSNDTLITVMMTEMDALQKNHWALEEHEAYEESEWAEELLVEKKDAVEKAMQALKCAEEDLAIANNTYHRIRHVPRQKRRGVNFKTKTTLDDRLEIRSKWDTLNMLLKTVGKEERKLEYLDRPWRLEKTDVPQAQVTEPEKVEPEKVEPEAPKETKGCDGLSKMSWARLYVQPPVREKVEPPQVQEVEPEEAYLPPPRVLDADKYWPFARCKNLAKIALKEKHSRNHFGLIQQLSFHYKMPPEQFKKTSPGELLKNNQFALKKILSYREYMRQSRA